MGEFCIHALGAKVLGSDSPAPAKVGPKWPTSPLCARCAEANYRPGDIAILEHHRNLIRAAGVLLDQGVGEEHTIIPTLVLATLSDRDEAYARAGERLLRAHGTDQEWVDLNRDFSRVFKPLLPEDPLNDVPIVSRRPIEVLPVKDSDGTGPVKSIKIEINKRVDSRDLRRQYAETLKMCGLPHDKEGGLIAWAKSGESLQMLVRPNEEPVLRPIFAFGTNLQMGFARPKDVAATYEALKTQGYSLGPGGNSSSEARITVAVVVAFFLGSRTVLSGDKATEVTRLVKACLATPRIDKSESWQKWRDQRWQLFARDLGPRLPHIRRAEQDFAGETNVYPHYGRVHKTF